MDNNAHRIELQRIARKVMIERGFNTEFPDSVLDELKLISNHNQDSQSNTKDMRNLLWCSIDNEDTLDIDQLSYAEQLPGNMVRVLIAIADVDALVNAESNIDIHASQNTSTIYTVAQIFPMLPEKLSTNLSSLGLNADRPAIVIEMIVDENGVVQKSEVFVAIVRNYAKLDYDNVAAWLDGKRSIPEEIAKIEGLAENIKLQDSIAQKMKDLRYERGALDFQSIESRPVFDGDNLSEMKGQLKNRTKGMIEDFMIACNGVTAQFLTRKNFPSMRRVVRTPKRWDRIVELAAEHNFTLPSEPDSKSLSQCMKFVKENQPDHYTDLSFSILKLLGGGEYVIEMPGEEPQGHFGLAVKNYSHSTAPNRRYPDLITHRLLKSAIAGNNIPYSTEKLEIIAKNCTVKEDDAKKVERQVEKSANAMLLESKIGAVFEAIVSGASPKGTWIRLFHPHLEGKLVKGFDGLQVGQKLKAKLTEVNVESGFIDFERVG
jgi:VacB/RNase II family 3'-5' exoribonuclease